MKSKQTIAIFAASLACAGNLFSQVEPGPADPPDLPPVDLPDAPAPPAPPADPANPIPDAPAQNPAEVPEIPLDEIEIEPVPKEDNSGISTDDETGGLKFNQTPINEAFEYLAKEAGFGYLANSNIEGPEFMITGAIPEGDPYTQMQAIAQFKSLELYQDKGIIYALDSTQLNQLPAEEWTYQLRYLRPNDIEEIKKLITPLLTPGAGIINYETKTNTIVVIDSRKKIQAVSNLLEKIDKAKGQIVIET